jgi:hypothetical protein
VSLLGDIAAAAEPALTAHAGAVTGAEPEGAVAGGPPGAGLADPTRAFVLEAVREGYLLHYGEPRAFAGMDDDLRLLGGDAMYALGLARLADEGDLEAVAELAELISACAQAESEGRPTAPLWADSAARLAAPYRTE